MGEKSDSGYTHKEDGLFGNLLIFGGEGEYPENMGDPEFEVRKAFLGLRVFDLRSLIGIPPWGHPSSEQTNIFIVSGSMNCSYTQVWWKSASYAA